MTQKKEIMKKGKIQAKFQTCKCILNNQIDTLDKIEKVENNLRISKSNLLILPSKATTLEYLSKSIKKEKSSIKRLGNRLTKLRAKKQELQDLESKNCK